MKSLRAALLLLLSYCLGVQPVVAQVQSAHVIAPIGVSGSAAAAAGSVTAGPSSLNGLGVLQPSALTLSAPAFQSAPVLSAPSAAASAMPSAAAPTAVSPAATRALLAAPVAGKAVTPAQLTRERIAPIEAAAAKAVEGLSKAGSDASRTQAAVQFSALTGERLRAYADGSETPAPAPKASETGASSSGLAKAAAPAAESSAKAEVPAPKSGVTTVFKDPARNSAFWRYITGYSVFLVGFEMYVVGLPYLISAMTRNSLKENGDARAANEEAVKALIRSNRSLARIAHWVAQGISYITIPLFMRNAETEGPKKWWVRATFIRAAALGLIPVLFFTTGSMGLGVALAALLVLLAAQSFFQGIAVTAEAAATTIIMGDKSVTADERTKANSIITVIAAVLAIIAPAIAGQIALIGPIMGKGGVGGAVIFGIYAATIAIAGFIYATVKLVRSKEHIEHANLTAKPAEETPTGLKDTLKELWVSIKDGTRIVLKDRLLRMLLILSMVSSLFSDPLIFNVLPEYIEGIVNSNPGTLGAIMNVPFLGAFLKSLTSSPMGNFALMMVMTSVGSILAAMLIKPLSRLFQKLGFKTEEALTVPFYFIAALEAPLFFLMIGTHTIIGVVLLYGLQSLAVGFIGIAISGLYQKKLGNQKDKDINKVLAAESLLGIGAAILSTFAYGFLLKDIAIGTSLTIAAVATGVMALLHLAAPFFAFTKAERRPPEPPPPAHATPPTGDHNGAK